MINRNTNAFRFYIVPTKRDRRRQLYSVIFNGKIVIDQTLLPSAAGCRYLASMGLTGRAEMWDFSRSYARMVFPDLVKAAGMTVKENGTGRPEVRIDREYGQGPIHEGFVGDNHPRRQERLSVNA
ncbi:hypothetical protein EHS39_14255 [Ensifer sp. MPMI2T]|nr:hypothetical protein EHS39_14255 [Ensifer sp. MPMI2T]